MNRFQLNLPSILKEYRLRANITQQELSIRLNTSLRSYQRFESGDAEPSIGQLCAISEILQFRLAELFNYSEKSINSNSPIQHLDNVGQALKMAMVGLFEYIPSTNDFICSDSFNYVTGKNCTGRLTVEGFASMIDDFQNRLDFLASFKMSYTTGAPIRMETRILKAGIELRYIELRIEPRYLNGIVERLIGTIIDITKYKELEMKLAKVLNEKEEINQLAGVGHWEYNIQDDILIWSDSAYGVFGVDKIKPIGKLVDFMERVHPNDRELIMASYQQSLITKQPYDVEHRIVTPAGITKWVLQKCITFLDQEGQPLRSKGFTFDVSRWKAA